MRNVSHLCINFEIRGIPRDILNLKIELIEVVHFRVTITLYLMKMFIKITNLMKKV